MSPRWSKFLELIGAPGSALTRDEGFDPSTIREGGWWEFLDYQALFRLFGPHPAGPWHPYHCPTLFAAMDRLRLIPRYTELAEEVMAPDPEGAFGWLKPGTLTVVEMSGGLAVQVGARLLVETGAQLVSTFDHWPQAKREARSLTRPEAFRNTPPRPWPPGDVSSTVAIDSRDILDAMVSTAPRVFARIKAGQSPNAPPVFLCDSRRLIGNIDPGPGDFDNRYFIDDSLIPSGELLKAQGIERMVYFSFRPGQAPSDDLCGFMSAWGRSGITFANVALIAPETWAAPIPMRVPLPASLAGLKFRKSQVGGFGREIPVPSEGSGSYAGGGG